MLAFVIFIIIIIFILMFSIFYEIPGINILNNKFYEKKRIAKEERLESIQNGGIDEPRPFRELTTSEKMKMLVMFKNSQRIRDNFWILIPIITIFDVYFLFEIITGKIDIAKLNFENVFYIVAIEIILIAYGLDYWSRYLDLRNPVFRVKGKAIKEIVRGEHATFHYITVKNLKFSDFDYNNFPAFFDSIEDKDEVIAEYSPRTKHVWKMYKAKDNS